jgi:hypothetical protein
VTFLYFARYYNLVDGGFTFECITQEREYVDHIFIQTLC